MGGYGCVTSRQKKITHKALCPNTSTSSSTSTDDNATPIPLLPIRLDSAASGTTISPLLRIRRHVEVAIAVCSPVQALCGLVHGVGLLQATSSEGRLVVETLVVRWCIESGAGSLTRVVIHWVLKGDHGAVICLVGPMSTPTAVHHDDNKNDQDHSTTGSTGNNGDGETTILPPPPPPLPPPVLAET